MTEQDGTYVFAETNSLGWPAYLFIIALCWIACWVLVDEPYRYLLAGGGTAAVLALSMWLRKGGQRVEIAGHQLTRSSGEEVEIYDISALERATYHWIPFYGSVVELTWESGRALEVPVVWSTRDFRRALGAALTSTRPARVWGDHASMRALRRAGLSRRASRAT